MRLHKQPVVTKDKREYWAEMQRRSRARRVCHEPIDVHPTQRCDSSYA